MNWCDDNCQTINISKTKHMLISSLGLPDSNQKSLNGNHLKNVCGYNYLGVITDNKLSFREFVEDKYNKVNQQVYQ